MLANREYARALWYTVGAVVSIYTFINVVSHLISWSRYAKTQAENS